MRLLILCHKSSVIIHSKPVMGVSFVYVSFETGKTRNATILNVLLAKNIQNKIDREGFYR